MTTLVKPKKKKTVSQHLWTVHWWMAAIYVLLFAGGTYMADLERDVSYRGSLYDFHKSLGVTAMILLSGRIILLLRKLQRKKPTAVRPLPEWERIRTVALHSLLYFFMLAVPLSGWFFSNSYDKDVALFGIGLPRLFPVNRELANLGRSAHFWLAYTFLAFLAVHAIDQWKFLRATVRRFWQSVLRAMAAPSKTIK